MGDHIDELLKELKSVDAIVVSYHGVVVPPSIPRYRALPDEAVIDLLSQLRRRYKVIIVSFRSYTAIQRTADAFDAAVCCNGCEIVTPDDIIVPRKIEEYTHTILNVFRSLEESRDFTVELRKTRFGDAVGVAIEWNGSLSVASQELINSIIGKVSRPNPRSKCLTVYTDQSGNYIEIFAPICRRARAIDILRKLMNLGRVAYIGEGLIDNEALRSVDVPIAVMHELNRDRIDKVFARYRLNRSQLIYVLKSLNASV